MLTVVKQNFNFFIQALKVSIMSAMEYKVSFLIQAVFMFINNGFFLVFWSVVFNINDGKLQDLEFDYILLLWSIPVISYGVTYFFFGGVTQLNTYIITGQMDSFMLQPKNPILNVITSKCYFSACGDLIYGLVIGIVASKYNIIKLLIIIISGIFGSVFYVSTEIILRAISVWLKDTENIANKYKDTLLTTFSNYPESIFSKGIKLILYTVVPAGYISFLPIKIFYSLDFRFSFIIIAVGILYLAAAILVFNKAMKCYESGNSISMKM